MKLATIHRHEGFNDDSAVDHTNGRGDDMEIKHWIVIVGMAYTGYQFFNTMYDVKNTRKLIVGIVVTISLFNLLFVK